jgi:hypothetical protein
MIETEELVCKKLHMPWPGVRIPANMRVVIGPPEIAEALCRRGFFERISPEILAQEVKPPDQEKPVKKKGK